MLYIALLSLHLCAAFASIGLIGYSLVVLSRHTEERYSSLAKTLGLLAGFEVTTGTLLAFISQSLLAVSLTLHIAAYLGVCVATELLLLRRMNSATRTAALSPMLAGAGLFAAAVVFGF